MMQTAGMLIGCRDARNKENVHTQSHELRQHRYHHHHHHHHHNPWVQPALESDTSIDLLSCSTHSRCDLPSYFRP